MSWNSTPLHGNPSDSSIPAWCGINKKIPLTVKVQKHQLPKKMKCLQKWNEHFVCCLSISIGSELPSIVCINLCITSPIQFCASDLLKISLQLSICFCESNLSIFTRLALRNRADCLHVRQTFSGPSHKTRKIRNQPFCWNKKLSHPKDMKYAGMQHNSVTSILMKTNLTVCMFTRRGETLLQWQNLSNYGGILFKKFTFTF